jgi:hypothetical protein
MGSDRVSIRTGQNRGARFGGCACVGCASGGRDVASYVSTWVWVDGFGLFMRSAFGITELGDCAICFAEGMEFRG